MISPVSVQAFSNSGDKTPSILSSCLVNLSFKKAKTNVRNFNHLTSATFYCLHCLTRRSIHSANFFCDKSNFARNI
jgi:hypothetical protein